MRIAIVANVVPEYRIPVLDALAQLPDVEVRILRPAWGSYAAGRPAHTAPIHASVVDMRAHTVDLGPLRVVRFPDVRRLLREWNADVVLVEARMGLVDAVLLALWPLKRVDRRTVALAWWVAGWRNLDRPAHIIWLSDLVTSVVVRRGHAAACYGSKAASRARDYGLPGARVVIAQNAIDPGRLPSLVDAQRSAQVLSCSGPLRVLFVGQILERKHLDWLLSAMAAPDASGSKVMLRVVGAGDALDALRRLADRLDLGDRVQWIGQTYDPEDLSAHIAWAEVGILPHAGGLMLNTCMAAGLPVICGEADGTEVDLITDGETGWLMRGRGPVAVAEALGRVMAQRDTVAAVGKSARRRIESTASVELMVEGLHRACRVAMERAGAGGR